MHSRGYVFKTLPLSSGHVMREISLEKIYLFAHTIIKLIFYTTNFQGPDSILEIKFKKIITLPAITLAKSRTYSFWKKKIFFLAVLSHLKTKLTQNKSNWEFFFFCINIIKCKKKKKKRKRKQKWSRLDFFWINFGCKFDKAAQVTTISSIWCSIVTGITPFVIRKNWFY